MKADRAVLSLGCAAITLLPVAGAFGQDEAGPLALGDSAADLVYTPVNPCRIIDTRLASGPIAAGTRRDFHVVGSAGFEAQGGAAGGCGIPAGATAVVFNFVAVAPAGPGNLRAWPFAQAMPVASILNYSAGFNLANGVVVPVCNPAVAICPFDLTVQADVSAAHLVTDVLGFMKGVPPQAVTTALLADGAVSGNKILDGSVGASDVDSAAVQLRVSGTCAVGNTIRAVNEDGTVTCEPSGTVTSVGTGAGLTGGPITASGTVSVAPGGITSGLIADGSVGAGDVDSAAVQLRVSGACAPGSAVRVVNTDGTVACQADSAGNDWRLGGNAGTNPATDFLGTTDNTPLEMRVNNLRVWRIEPGFEGPNVLGGSRFNEMPPGVSQATIAGGGGLSPSPFVINRVTDIGGTVGGGIGNLAGDNAGTVLDQRYPTVAGGEGNTASGPQSTVGGGVGNTASGPQSTVPGGFLNVAGGHLSLAAGFSAKVRPPAEVGGGDVNGDEGTFVWSDVSSSFGFASTGPNQFLVRAAGGVGINTNSPSGDLQLGAPAEGTAFKFGSSDARHHLVSSRDMVFNAFDSDTVINGSPLFLWRRNPMQFAEGAAPVDLMTLGDNGNLNVVGTLTKGGGSFKIDHPLDPENKYLYHSFVESPDMMNIYNGNATTGDDGFATVELPEWFEALNRDFRYQLTVVGRGSWARARIAREVERNRFVIETDVPGTKVSWQVTGIRQDAFAESHRIPVEEDKPADQRGRCLHARACVPSTSPDLTH